jgi:CBS-domain-containing membrane protein
VPPHLPFRKSLARGPQATLVAALLGALSLAAHTPFLFPALGASAFILIVHPESPAASARNVLGTHLVAAAAGWLCFWAFGLVPGGPTLAAGGGVEHVAAAALALGLTTFLLLMLGLQHPPAVATTLTFALGFLPHAWQIAMVGASALLLVLLVRALARLAPAPAR